LATAFLHKRGKPSQLTSEKATYRSKLEDLIAARKDLVQRIFEAQPEARALSVAKVRAVMAEFGLTAAAIGGRSAGSVRVSGAAKAKAAVKHHNAATGDNWTGRAC